MVTKKILPALFFSVVAITAMMLFPSNAKESAGASMTALEKENESLRNEVRVLRNEHYKAAEYDSVYARMERMERKGFTPDVLVLWAIRDAWIKAGMSDSSGIAWAGIENSLHAVGSNWLGEKGCFMISEQLIREMCIRFKVDTVGFDFTNYQGPMMQAKWAAFTQVAIRMVLGRSHYWAYNSGAWINDDALEKDFDAYRKWKAGNTLRRKR
jgi:hypothetical protein